MDMGGTFSAAIPLAAPAIVPIVLRCVGSSFVTERMSGYVARLA